MCNNMNSSNVNLFNRLLSNNLVECRNLSQQFPIFPPPQMNGHLFQPIPQKNMNLNLNMRGGGAANPLYPQFIQYPPNVGPISGNFGFGNHPLPAVPPYRPPQRLENQQQLPSAT